MKGLVKTLLAACFSIVSVFSLAQEHYMNLLEEGNSFYINNEFDAALERYNAVEDAGYFSASLYFNKANAHYKLGNTASAILYYEKTLKIAPNDADAKFNLSIVNSQIIDEINAIDTFFVDEWLTAFRTTFSSTGWSTIALFFFWIALTSIVTYLLTKNSAIKKLAFVSLLFFGALSVIGVRMAHATHQLESNSTEAIVFEPSVDIHSEPSANSTRLFVIHEGLKVRLEDQVENWVEIVLPDGNKGWVLATSLEKI